MNVDKVMELTIRILPLIPSYAIIAGAIFLKVPQIIKILTSQSVAGLSFSALVIEIIAYMFTLAYSMRIEAPFSTYGEGFFAAIQDLIIGLLMVLFASEGRLLRSMTLSILCLACYPLGVMASTPLLTLLQSSTVVLFIVSRAPQIYSAFKLKSTGQLALTSIVLAAVGNAVRVATLIAAGVTDVPSIAPHAAGLILNLIIIVQFAMYRNGPAKEAKEAKKDE